MPRSILDEARVHPAIRARIADHHADLVHNVQAASQSNPVLVVDLLGNLPARRVRRALKAAGQPFHHLQIGSYFGAWRRRNALKMWTGWPTFPMVFVKGQLVGGAEDTIRLIESGELRRLLGE